MTAGDGYPRRDHVHWVRIPDEPEAKRRPALIVSPDTRNRLASDLLVVPISSILRDAPTQVRLRRREAGLPRASMAKCEQITTLRRDRLSVKPLGGALSSGRMLEIEKTILRAIGVPVV
jgi:mRNA-degrading endonuclease toxin of MazEF toxin-antitoxin module